MTVLLVSALEELGETLIGIETVGPVMFIHMRTEQDAIIAKNRLRFCGFAVSEETHQIELTAKDGGDTDGAE